jgi:hypothetical protein
VNRQRHMQVEPYMNIKLFAFYFTELGARKEEGKLQERWCTLHQALKIASNPGGGQHTGS